MSAATSVAYANTWAAPNAFQGSTTRQSGAAVRAIAERAGADCLVVDPWNALGTGQVFAYVSEVVALQA